MHEIIYGTRLWKAQEPNLYDWNILFKIPSKLKVIQLHQLHISIKPKPFIIQIPKSTVLQSQLQTVRPLSTSHESLIIF